MSKRITVFMLLTLTILLNLNLNLTAQNQPKAWYVYKNANGLNNGTSWANAWVSPTNINWSLIQPGDIIYISGGIDSLTYTDKLIIEKRFGEPGKFITITKGRDPGHNGKVIFDGDWVTSLIVDIRGSQYITVKNINIKKSNLIVRRADNPTTASRVIIIDSVNVEGVGAKGGISLGGYPTLGLVDSVIVSNCRIIHNEITDVETDLISFGYTKNVFIRNNYLYHYNNNNHHSDAIQAQNMNENLEISGNYIEHVRPDTTVTGYADNMVIIRDVDGIVKVFNNVFYYRTHPSWFNVVLHDYYVDPGQLHIYNNTFIGYQSHTNVIYTDITDSVYIKNNIFFDERIQSTTSDYPLFQVASTIPASNLNYNLFYNPNGYPYLYSYNGYNRTLAQLQSSGAELNSMQGQNPLFVDFNGKDYRLQSTSPAKDAGVDLSTFFNTDKNGVTRPQGSAWDIGAFEYFDNQLILDNDPPEVVAAIIIDSITVNVTFSEPMDQSSVTNPSNYSIDNGIVVNSAQSLSTKTVQLNTSVHSPGFYTLTVSNTTDTAGNLISLQGNSISYGYNPDPLPSLLKFVPTGTLASAIPEPEHLPEKTFDGLGYNSGDPTSRWAAQGLPQWIVYDLGDIKMINKTRIQFFRWLEGRVYTYSILISTDSLNWNYVRQNIQSGSVEWNEESFEPTSGRYVKILITGNNENDWANIWETEIYGQLIISENDDLINFPKEFKLEQNYPNPFNPTTKIRYSIPRSTEYYSVQQKVTLKVYDILGNEIATLVDDYKSAGNYEVDFNASDIASGVYIYRLFVQDLQAKDEKNSVYTESKKMLLMR